MKRFVKSLYNCSEGFTVLELLIAFLITGIVAGATTTAILQIFSGSAHTSNHMTAVRQVQTAGYWVTLDAQTSETITLEDEVSDDPDGTRFPLTLTWIDWDNVVHEVKYELVNMPNSNVLKNLQREYYIDTTLTETSIVAQYINPDPTKTNCKLSAGAFSMPNINDVCTITDDTGGDSGFIIVINGSISVTRGGTATYDAVTGAWTTPTTGDTVTITATSANTSGYWTYTTGTVTISPEDATRANGGLLIFMVTSTVGTGSQERSETRAYEVFSRPSA